METVRRSVDIKEYSWLARPLYAKGTLGHISFGISNFARYYVSAIPSFDLDLLFFGFVLPITKLTNDRPNVQFLALFLARRAMRRYRSRTNQ